MKNEYMPYYISRAVISALFAILVMGLNWKAALLAIVFYGIFLFYLHSGWYSVDLKSPLFPLRRDSHGQLIQRKALIASIFVGILIYLTSSQLSELTGLSLSGDVAFAIGVITYFATQFFLLLRA